MKEGRKGRGREQGGGKVKKKNMKRREKERERRWEKERKRKRKKEWRRDGERCVELQGPRHRPTRRNRSRFSEAFIVHLSLLSASVV